MASFLCWTICHKASGLKGVEALDIGLGNHKEVLDHGEAVVEPMSALEGKRRHGGVYEREGEPIKAGGHALSVYC